MKAMDRHEDRTHSETNDSHYSKQGVIVEIPHRLFIRKGSTGHGGTDRILSPVGQPEGGANFGCPSHSLDQEHGEEGTETTSSCVVHVSTARHRALLALLFLDEALPTFLHCRLGLVIRAAILCAVFVILAVSRCRGRSSTLIGGRGGLTGIDSSSIGCVVTLGHVDRISKVDAFVNQVGVISVVLDSAVPQNNNLVTTGQEVNMVRNEQPRRVGRDFSGDGSSEEMLTDMSIYRRERVVQKKQFGLL
mmetsp:Transcript_22301/g.64016  ORF Transcript_22301/g.64016 Transcript_22301/m.64016 type:complete len:248 (+) Transcript_22301:369-1112(+)